jgi:hypothetical protein
LFYYRVAAEVNYMGGPPARYGRLPNLPEDEISLPNHRVVKIITQLIGGTASDNYKTCVKSATSAAGFTRSEVH